MVTLNRRKKAIMLDQADQNSVILSYTPYVTCKQNCKRISARVRSLNQDCMITVLLEFHDYMSMQADGAQVDLGECEEFWPLLVMLGQERSVF